MIDEYKNSWGCTCTSYGFCVLCGRHPRVEIRNEKTMHISSLMLDALKNIENNIQDDDKKASIKPKD